MRNVPSKSINTDNLSEYDSHKKFNDSKDLSISKDLGHKDSKLSPTLNRISKTSDIASGYNDSVFSKFYILNEKNDGTKLSRNTGERHEEDFKIPTKKPNPWSKLFCCYIEDKYE